MVWGCIDMEEKSDLVIFDENVTAAVYLDQVINPEIVPLFQRRNNLIFMQDNARPHTAPDELGDSPAAVASKISRSESHGTSVGYA